MSKYDDLDLASHSQAPYAKSAAGFQFTLKPVTSNVDIPSLGTINDRALDIDPKFKEWMALFTERTERETAVQAVTEALNDPEYRVVKVVVNDPDGESGSDEKIVGFIHWFCGWIQLEKIDPFAMNAGARGNVVVKTTNERHGQLTLEASHSKQSSNPDSDKIADVRDVASNMAEHLADEAAKAEGKAASRQNQHDLDRARRLKKGERKYVETRNHYIAAIRGKRHMFIRRIMVLPEYQGMGIGSRLMKVVTDEADRLKIVCWLFARPKGVKMYELMGYKTMGVTDMNEAEENFECEETRSMMRVPQPYPSMD